MLVPDNYTEVEYTPEKIPSEPERAFMSYNFLCGTNEQAQELVGVLRESLIHVVLGMGIDEEPPLQEYSITASSTSITVFIDSTEYTRNNHVGDLIEETAGMWTSAAITFGYFDDMHGDVYTFRYDEREETLYLTSHFSGNEGYRGWDAEAAAKPIYGSKINWQHSHPGQMYELMWPATEHEDRAYVIEVLPDDWIEVGENLDNLLKE